MIAFSTSPGYRNKSSRGLKIKYEGCSTIVLPPSIAARKLAGESPVADSFSEASVLFADVVDFTSLSARLESPQIVSMLNELFSRFDRISARHGLEKIKTIGDCYMAVAGIPEVAAGHLTRAAQAAIEMLDEARYTRAPACLQAS